MSYARHLAVASAALLATAGGLSAQDAQPAAARKRADAPPAVAEPAQPGKAKEKSPEAQAPVNRPAEDSPDSLRPVDPADAVQAEPRVTPQRREPIATDARDIQFAFLTAPWDRVLQWFSELSGLSLLMDVKPTGTFNYINDPRKYTVGEAMDVLNEQLVLKGFYLVRKDNYLRVVALPDGIPPDLIPQITREKLAKCGKSEFVSLIVPVKDVLAKAASEEIKGLSGQYGKVTVLESSNRLMLTDTAANVRLMLEMLTASTDRSEVVQSKIRVFQLKYTVASKVEPTLRELLGLPPRTTTAPTTESRRSSRDPGEEMRDRMRSFFQGGGGPGSPGGMAFGGFPGFGGDQRGGGDERRDRGGDGRDRGGREQQQQQQQPNVAVMVDERLNQIFVKAPTDTLALVEELISKIDTPREPGQPPFTPKESQAPIVKIIRIDGDAQSLASALQTIYQNTPGVKFSANADNAIIVVATPDDQKAITALIQQFEEENLEWGVLQLSVLDATSVSDLLTAVYSSGQTDFRGRSVARPGQPRIQPDEAHSRIVIRGSKKQIDDIKLMLAKLGETSLSSGGGSDRMFLIPNGQNQRTTLEQIKQVWDTAHPNNAVRIIDLGRRTGQPGRGDATDGTEPSSGPPRDPEAIKDRSNSPAEDESPAKPRGARPMSGSGRPDRTSRDSRSDVKFASLTDQDPPQPPSDVDSTARQQPGKEGSPIVIAPGPDVTVITCEDPEALQRFMTLFNTLMRGSGGGGQDYNVFYLKAADATQVSTQLLDLLAPSSTSTSGGGFPFFGGGTPARTSTLKIVPDTRTNSLIVSGTTNDVLRVGQLLEVLDRADAPSSGALSAPRIIPVKYSSAATVYQVIRDVYSTQLVAGSRGPSGFPGFTVGGFGGFGGGQSPGGSGGTSGRGARGAGTLSIGVDDRSNSLVVSCSEATYKEINQLVELLDKAANDTKRTVKIVTIRNSTPTAVQEALYGLMGVNTNTRSRGYDSGRSSGFPQGGAFMGGGFPGGFPGGGAPFMFGRGSDGRGDFDRGDREGRGFDRGGGGGGGFPGFPFGGGGDRRP